jgi:uncharacterized protein (TIGR03067 family)
MPRTRALVLPLVLLMGLAPCVCLAQDVPPVEIPPSLVAHQGRWRGVATEREGKSADPSLARSILRTVSGDRVVWSRDGKTFAATRMKADPGATPWPTIDLLPEGGPSRGKTVVGIYRIDPETRRLTICMADPDMPRPSEFAARPGQKQTLMVFEPDPSPAVPTAPDGKPEAAPPSPPNPGR